MKIMYVEGEVTRILMAESSDNLEEVLEKVKGFRHFIPPYNSDTYWSSKVVANMCAQIGAMNLGIAVIVPIVGDSRSEQKKYITHHQDYSLLWLDSWNRATRARWFMWEGVPFNKTQYVLNANDREEWPFEFKNVTYEK